MIKKINQQTLAEFADTFVAKAEQFKNTKGTKEYLSNLQIRISQLKTFSDRGHFISNASAIMSKKGITHVIPKRKLTSRIKSLKNIVEEFKDTPEIIIQPKKFDADKFDEMFSEIEKKLKSEWVDFISHDKRADSFKKVSDDDPAISKTVMNITNLISNIAKYKSILPEKTEDVDYIDDIKKKICRACDKLESEGVDQEISEFLSETKYEYGFPLKRLIESNNLLNWIKNSNRANTFVVKRKK